MLIITKGTVFEQKADYAEFIADYILNGFEPLTVNGGIMAMTAGRSGISGNERYNLVTTIRSAAELVDMADEETAARLKKYIKRTVSESGAPTAFYRDTRMTPNAAETIEKIMNDDSIGAEPFEGSKTFYGMDRAVHQTENWAAGLAMSSSRVANYESCNGVNTDGWYTGDGMLYVYGKNDKSCFDSTYGKYADPYKRPGTTVDSQTREAISVKVGKEYFSGKDFVGGVTLNGKYTAAAMELESFHNSVAESFEDTGSGGPQAVHSSDLTAKKSWFMFDEEIVALGSGINSSDGFEVYTTVENRKLSSGEILADGSALQGDEGKTSARWINADSNGYCFPDGSETDFRIRTAGGKKFFELWKSHGKSPESAKYSYVLLPCASAAETAEYAANPRTAVIENSDTLQAVEKASSGLCGMVFWSAGSCRGVSVSDSAAVLVRETETEYRISFSDPTQKKQKLEITVGRLLECVQKPQNVTVTSAADGKSVIIEADLTAVSGESMEVVFLKK